MPGNYQGKNQDQWILVISNPSVHCEPPLKRQESPARSEAIIRGRIKIFPCHFCEGGNQKISN